jgi:hypothetical protein
MTMPLGLKEWPAKSASRIQSYSTLRGIQSAPRRTAIAWRLFESCDEPGKYKVSDELRKNGEVPEMEDGSEIGTAEGSWVKGMSIEDRET